MDINQVMQELDQLFMEEKTGDIEAFLEKHITLAENEEAWDAVLVLLNETIGFYRETGQYEKSVQNCHKAIALMESMNLQGTIPYATTLLNVANAHRAAGLLQESLDYYTQVFPVYEKLLAPDDMYYANLYNNISLLYQEMGDFTKAKENLQSALAIVEKKENTAFEIAVTHANLANTCIAWKQNEEAKQHALEAIAIFEKIGVEDAHYSAALSALGSLYYQDGDYKKAREMMEKSRQQVAKYLGTDNVQYRRLTENIELLVEKEQEESQVGAKTPENGMSLCRAYYETYGKPMITEKFPSYESKIAVGLVGKGSDCFGFDDEQSRDHDFGPRFVMWATRETYDEIGEALQQAYEALPTAFMGITRVETFHGRDRAGVMVIEDFYQNVLGTELINDMSVTNWLATEEYALAAAVNGEVFRDDEGIFSTYREKLLSYYPKAVWYRKLAQACALFSQNGQYNLPRMRKRGQLVAAELAKAACLKQAMLLTYLLERRYAPHDKWLFKGMADNLPSGEESDTSVKKLVEQLCTLSVQEQDAQEMTRVIETLAVIFAKELERQNIVGTAEAYLDANTQEILCKSDALLAAYQEKSGGVIEALSLAIAKLEFEAFDKVQNEGGRASCQNNWPTFKVMRMSQYLTWDEDMLLQYLYDFKSNYEKGRNMIQEKYARMMASTAPQDYEKFADTLPPISEDKKAIMEEIISLQVQWMEEFAAKYPGLAQNARLIHTSEDQPYDTSYETYLRGELGTYSDKMLVLYGRYIIQHAQESKNLAFEIMENTIHFYGYDSFEEALAKNS